jgi:hypothetical protein
VGVSALEGLKGVKHITKGFLGSREINRVYYDPELVSTKKMEGALKEAGTYLGTMKWNATRH